MDVDTKQSVLSRLTRIGGQIEGIRRMLEEDRHGVDVTHPIAAAQAALSKVGNEMLKAQIEAGLLEAVASTDTHEGAQGKGRRADRGLLPVRAQQGEVGATWTTT